MDSKSLAKSKRAHSLHHSKKHHPNPKAKIIISSEGASSKDKAAGKTIKEKPRQGPAALPSNWDRYEDEYDSVTENTSEGQSNQPNDIVVRKSKGADYAYLISEAKSQYSAGSSTEIFPSFDDFVTDFDQGKGSFFSVRGERMVSSIQNDSFVVEDKGTRSHEASFLSLDLHALAEQLAKVDLPKRLFMEADLFPRELIAEGLMENHNSGQDQDLYGNEGSHKVAAGEKYGEALDYTSTSDNHVQDHTTETRQSSKVTIVQPTMKRISKPAAEPSEKQSKFVAETAEAELDLLLNSFTDSMGFMEKNSSPAFVAQGENSTSILPGVSSQFIPCLPDRGSTVPVDVDDRLDDLLNGTTHLNLSDQNGTLLPSEATAGPGFVSSPSHPVPKSKLLDDFDSWLDTI